MTDKSQNWKITDQMPLKGQLLILFISFKNYKYDTTVKQVNELNANGTRKQSSTSLYVCVWLVTKYIET